MTTYIDDTYSSVGALDGLPVSWKLLTYDRLEWLYGHERASRIIEGRDPKTQMDLTAWRALGHRSAA